MLLKAVFSEETANFSYEVISRGRPSSISTNFPSWIKSRNDYEYAA